MDEKAKENAAKQIAATFNQLLQMYFSNDPKLTPEDRKKIEGMVHFDTLDLKSPMVRATKEDEL